MKKTIHSLQVFRGLAALAVVCHHASLSTVAFVAPIPATIQSIFSMGHLGVDFFFILSGFIITYAHLDEERSSFAAARKYSYKRIVRIFPAYLPISIGLISLYILFPEVSKSGGREFSILSSIFLLPAEHPPALPVAWTLVHELMFYFIFLTFFISSRLFITTLFLWGSAILYTNFLGGNAGWLRYPLSMLNFEFILGVVAAWYVKSQKLPCRVSCLIAGGTLVAITSLAFMQKWNEMRVVFAIGLALNVIGFASLEKNTSIQWPSILLLLGNASYSIYLIHNPLLSVTQRIMGKFNIDWKLSIIFGVVVSSLTGIVYYRLIEKPSLRYFRSRSRAK